MVNFTGKDMVVDATSYRTVVLNRSNINGLLPLTGNRFLTIFLKLVLTTRSDKYLKCCYLSGNMSGKGHRRLRLCSKKNYERKKYQLRCHDAPPDAP